MLNITHYQRNANQDHNEVPFHTSQNGCDPKVYKHHGGFMSMYGKTNTVLQSTIKKKLNITMSLSLSHTHTHTQKKKQTHLFHSPL